MQTFIMEWDADDVRGAIQAGFNYVERKDVIVTSVLANPSTMQKVVYAVPEDVKFDYIPDGIGFIRTAYFRRKILKDNEIRFISQDSEIELRLIFK